MIECTNKNIWYKKRRKKSHKRLFAFFLIFTVLIAISTYYKFVVCRRIYEISSDYVYKFCTESVNDAVLTSLSNNIKYSELITIEKNNSGEILLMSANSYKINYLSREIIDYTSKILDKKLSKGIPIPLLAFTGINLISAYGSLINFYAINVSSVICDFSSEFKSVGINQTLHSIYVNVICSVKIELPLSQNIKTCETSVLVSETVLVGKVPEIYLSGKLFG